MKKKNIKKKLYMSLSVLIIGFLISTSSLNIVSTKALIEENHYHYTIDSFYSSAWIWSATEVVSTESTSNSEHSSLAVDSSMNIHIVWQDATDYAGAGTDWDIFYKRWNSSSSLWTTAEVVSTESTLESYSTSLAVDSAGNVHIVWDDATDYAGSGTDRDIFYKRWNSSSSIWTTTEVVSTESTVNSLLSSLAVDSAENIHIAWQDVTNYAGAGTDWDIFYKRWNASSSSWTTTEVVSTESPGHSQYLSLAVDPAKNVHVAWEDLTDYAGAGTDSDIFYKRWDFSTESWTTTEVVSTASTIESYSTSLAVDSAGNVHVAWQDYTNYAGAGTDGDIFYKSRDATFSSWTITEVVSTESTDHCYFPSLAVDSAGNVHIAWQDYTNYAGAGTEGDIFYKSWDASSYTWTTTEIVSTESTGESRNPSLATDSSGHIHVAWHDGTDYLGAGGTDMDIFYKFLSGPPATLELAFIVPNPAEFTTVYLDWNNVLGAATYYVYRSASYIWSVEGLVPITTVSSSDHIDILLSEGFYYYVVVAGNLKGNSTHSNCQYVEVKFPDLDTPELAFILPNPIETSSIALIWDNIDGAIEYYIYRSASYIWSVEVLTPIATVGSNSYVDNLPSEGTYFYVIVATDGEKNSTHSNCEYIEYELPSLDEFIVISSLILGTFVFMFVVTRIPKKNSKPN